MRILKSRYLRGIRPTSLPPQYQHDVHWHVDSIAILRRGLKLCQRPTARIFNVQSTTRFYGPKGSEFLIPSLKKKNLLNQTKICLATRKHHIFLKETIFVSFNFCLNWKKRKLFISNIHRAYGWNNEISFDSNLFSNKYLFFLKFFLGFESDINSTWNSFFQEFWMLSSNN